MPYIIRPNILLDHYFNAKLGDFGFAYEVPEVKQGRTMVTAPSFARTEGYYAPELVHGQVSAKCDVYSYGVVSYFFITVTYILEGIILFQVVLETFTGLRAYSTKRDDRKLVCVMPDICMTMMMQDY